MRTSWALSISLVAAAAMAATAIVLLRSPRPEWAAGEDTGTATSPDLRFPRSSHGSIEPVSVSSELGASGLTEKPLAGGALPIVVDEGGPPSDWPEGPAIADHRTEPAPGPGRPARELENPLRGLGAEQEPDRLSILPREARAIPRVPAPHGETSAPAEQGPVRGLSDTQLGARLPGSAPRDPTEEELVGLMRLLHATDTSAAQRAREELMVRGFGSVHLELASQMFDPDPEVRKRLTRMLPGLRSIDPVPWLLWLGRDADAEVRLAAMSLLATTGDPKLLDQVEELARQDPDPQIQRLAQRVAQRQGDGRER